MVSFYLGSDRLVEKYGMLADLIDVDVIEPEEEYMCYGTAAHMLLHILALLFNRG